MLVPKLPVTVCIVLFPPNFYWVSLFGGLEWTTGMDYWNTGMDYWNGLLEWLFISQDACSLGGKVGLGPDSNLVLPLLR